MELSTEVDPFRDARVTRIPGAQKKDFNVQAQSFGQEGDEERKLKTVSGLSSNSKGHFIVGDNEDCIVRIFDRNGKFLDSLFSLNRDENTNVHGICDVATDQNDNVYVLVTLEKKATELVRGVYVFDQGPVVQRVDNAIHRINRYLADK